MRLQVWLVNEFLLQGLGWKCILNRGFGSFFPRHVTRPVIWLVSRFRIWICLQVDSRWVLEVWFRVSRGYLVFFFFLVDSHCSLCEANFPGKIFCVFMILVVWLKNGLFKV